MPPTSLQSRISAFESLVQSSSHKNSPTFQSQAIRNSDKNSPTAIVSSTNSPTHHTTPLSPPSIAALLPQKLPFSTHKHSSRPVSPSPSSLERKTSLIDLKDWVVDVAPSSSPNGRHPLVLSTNGNVNGNTHGFKRTPIQPIFNTPEKASNTPLINLESSPSQKPKPKPKPKALVAKPLGPSSVLPPLKAPPLPPRKPSYTSLKSVSSTSSVQNNLNANGPIVSSPSRRSDSLTVEHTYPPLEGRTRIGSGHAPASSISSFHSVSLSSDTDPSTPGSLSNFVATFPVDHDRDYSFASNASEADSVSLDESYENVSTPSLASPSVEHLAVLDWKNSIALGRSIVPPQLPMRPSTSSFRIPSVQFSSQQGYPPGPPSAGSRSTPSSPKMRPTLSTASSSSTIAAINRRVPPPPPSITSRSSHRSSIQSTVTSLSLASSTSTHRALSVTSRTRRPTPVPPAARKRFEGVFNANIIQRRRAEKQKEERPALLTPSEARRTRQAAGWRGLSVDLITGGEVLPGGVGLADSQGDNVINEEVRPEERLEACHVKLIWNHSGLAKSRLKEIWSESDTANQGSLDCEQFVRGMWRIDEDLRRLQFQTIKSANNLSLGSLRMRQGPVNNLPKFPTKPRPILR